ncbi:MAG: hypothetical protein RLN60_05550 [Phycisphaerales bacterium]
MTGLNRTHEGVIFHLAFTLGSTLRASELAELLGVDPNEINAFLVRKIYGPINEMIRERMVG